MGVLSAEGVQSVFHYSPLHYLIFIARTAAILSKSSLRKAGFNSTHFRSTSMEHDIARGFGDYAHLTIAAQPKILKSKLAAGFPHVALAIPVNAVEAVPFSLCRFNVAMTRCVRRGNKCGYSESATNGRYYPDHQIPIARTAFDKTAMLKKHLPNGAMIEVLVRGKLNLPDKTSVVCFSKQDTEIVSNALAKLNCRWTVQNSSPLEPYPRDDGYVALVADFIERALLDPSWRGNGLEFDRLSSRS